MAVTLKQVLSPTLTVGLGVVNLLVKKPKLAKIDTITLDASIEESHQFNSKITQFPVETGATITDHIFNEPKRLTIEAIVSNYPLPLPDPALIARTLKYSLQPTKKFTDAVFQDLMDIRDSRKLITVVTRLKSYDNMAVMSITIPRNKDNQEVLRFTIELQEVTQVSTEKVAANYTSKTGKPKASRANQTTSPASTLQKQQGASILYKIGASFSSIFK
jgi:hypothetical protein